MIVCKMFWLWYMVGIMVLFGYSVFRIVEVRKVGGRCVDEGGLEVGSIG